MTRRSLFVHPAVDLAGRLLRPIVPAKLWHRYCDWRYSHLGRQSWLTREDKLDGQIAMYWGSMNHPNRTQLIALLGGLIPEHGREKPVVLEFGCHAGMNFKLLHDRFADRIRYCGVEPNHDACEFLRRELPFVELLEAEDRAFLATDFPRSASVDVSFVNVVMYSVHGTRAKRVLERLCRVSDVIVLGEQLGNTSDTSRFERDPDMYAHPYVAWLRSFGFREQQIVPPVETSPQLSGYLIARRA